MAVAKLSCGACGATLPEAAASCPRCGEVVELPVRADGGGAADTTGRICSVCGHRNPGDGAFCESCGASLQRETPADAPASGAVRGNTGRRVKPSKFALGAVIVVLLVLLVYLQYTRSPSPSSAPPTAAAPPVQAPMEEVRRLQDAVRANPGDAASVLKLANLLHDLGLSEPGLLNGAIDAYRHYLGLKPSDPDARVDLGICYFELGRADSVERPQLFEAAVREMEAAFKGSPKHQPAAFNLGVVNLFMGNAERSTQWFRKAVELGPETELGKRAKSLLEQHAFSPSAR